ncbi:Chain length determinant protein [Pseudomonas sp. GM102]|uniref:Wzz/FepE/Etk N-terminal domain-containing protein n=1 Tax=Pseudomonas sp. GM102 TaxID=1144321 RepID=UPI00026F8976|nr:Wzz/FepE/Etk N-terminal domain-containing protein [Pseudomonas sp. GM102]EJM01464.1 Chain length determinant protein [Pseudomonas sp. GM102]
MHDPEVKNDVEAFTFVSLLKFLTQGWKFITAGAVFGLLGATAYLWVTPLEYEASAIIRMAENRGLEGDGPPITNQIESATSVIARLNSPAAYSGEVLRECGLDDVPEAKQRMTRLARYTAEGQPAFLMVNVRARGAELASKCAEGIFEMVRQQQDVLSQPGRERLSQMVADLRKSRQAHLDALGGGGGVAEGMAVYLAHRDAINKIEAVLRKYEYALGYVPTQLISVYPTPEAVFPRQTPVILLGLITGLLVGLLAACLRRVGKS